MPFLQSFKVSRPDTFPVKDKLALFRKSLEGIWLLERTFSTGEKLTGKAVFECISDTAFLLHEEGELHLANGTRLEAKREWYWFFEAPDVLEITYDKARKEPYHLLAIRSEDGILCADAEHFCGRDVYTGHYRLAVKRLEIRQTVKGPVKDYEVTSVYSK